jgi:NhaP-type Na+/H+ or K+/H+ antiporter
VSSEIGTIGTPCGPEPSRKLPDFVPNPVGLTVPFIFLVRPAAGLVSLAGALHPLRERAAIAFFGIRGLGSFYYLAYALNEASFPDAKILWSVLGFTVLLSVLLHGTTVTPFMAHLDRRRERQARRATAGLPV